MRACALRLTNVYGPRQLIKHNRQGFIAWFIRLALEDKEIQVFGDGSQVRDFVYVDDAVDAFLRGRRERRVQRRGVQRRRRRARSRIAISCTLLVELAGSGRYRFVEWPPEKKAIDIGSFYADSTRFNAARRLDARGPAARRPGAHAGVSTASTCATTSTEPGA